MLAIRWKGDFMGLETICQFYIIIGDKDFRPLNKKDVYINATGVNDINLISMAISREYKKKMSMEKPAVVSNKIIFLVPSNEYDSVCKKIVNELGIMYYEIKNISEYIVKNTNEEGFEAVRQVESDLVDNNNITASGSENIEVQKGGITTERITISDNKAYKNGGMLTIDEQKYSLLQEWKNDPNKSRELAGLSAEEIDRMLMESVTMNLTSHRMESPSEQNAYDDAGEVAKEKATKEDGLYNPQLRVVRNNVSSSYKYSAVEESNGKPQVVNPNVSNPTINSGGISDDSGGRKEDGIMNVHTQTREVLEEYYLDDEYNIYNSDGVIMGRVGQNGVWVDYNTNTLVMNGKLVGYVGDYKNMGKSADSLDKTNVRVKKKEELKSAAFVSLPVIMFVLSAMLLIGSLMLLFVL